MGNCVGVDASGSIARVVATVNEDPKLCLEVEKCRAFSGNDFPFSEFERRLIGFLKEAPIWTLPWVFETKPSSMKLRLSASEIHDHLDSSGRCRVYCFCMNLKDFDQFAKLTCKWMVDPPDPCPNEFPPCQNSEGLSNYCEALRNRSHKPWTLHMYLTGSGATKFAKCVETKWAEVYPPSATGQGDPRLHLTYCQEILAILKSLNYLSSCMPETVFRYSKQLIQSSKSYRRFTDSDEDEYLDALPLSDEDAASFYPYLLVNMKAGVSFHKVTSPNNCIRVGGSTIGGATFVGLVRLLCNSSLSPFDAFVFSQSGDETTVDMLVEDIYGGDIQSIGLKGNLIASTLGKLQLIKPAEPLASAGPASGLLPTPSLSDPSEDLDSHLSIPLAHVCSLESLVTSHLDSNCRSDGNDTGSEFQNSGGTGVSGLKCRDVLGEDSSRVIHIKPLRTDLSNGKSIIRAASPSEVGSEPELERRTPRKTDCYHVATSDLRKGVWDESILKAPSEADVARSLLSMMSFNVAQLAYFNSVVHKCNRIVLTGYYLEMPGFLAAIQRCVDFWSKGTCTLHFVRVAPFLGAFGATLG